MHSPVNYDSSLDTEHWVHPTAPLHHHPSLALEGYTILVHDNNFIAAFVFQTCICECCNLVLLLFACSYINSVYTLLGLDCYHQTLCLRFIHSSAFSRTHSIVQCITVYSFSLLLQDIWVVSDFVPACMLSHLSCVWLLATPWTTAHQVTLSMGFPRQECWSRLPFPTRGFSHPRDHTCVSCTAGRFFTTEPLGKPLLIWGML